MKISYYVKKQISYFEDARLVSEISNFSLPRVFQVNKDLKLLSCNDRNFEMYKSLFGFGLNQQTIWIEFPQFLRKSSYENFLIGVSFDYLKVDFKEIDQLSQQELTEIIDIKLSNDEQLMKIMEDEYASFTKDLRNSEITPKMVKTFVIRVTYYLSLFLVMKIKDEQLMLNPEHQLM